MINKKGFEFSFGWIFAIFVGAAIIFLAIYAATSITKQGRNVQDTLAGQQLGIILSPVETSLQSINKAPDITFPVVTRVYNTCDSTGNFGVQKISIATQSGVGAQWQNPGVPSTFYNKYIFSASTLEGKTATAFDKPFNFPFKVADLIYLLSNNEKYCFIDSPNDIQDELSGLSIANINFTSDVKDCAKNSIEVCFVSSGCDIDVNLNSQSVKKYKQVLYYTGDDNALLYAAIFSDPAIYECQMKRLMKRTSQLAILYEGKSEALSPRGCSTNMESDLAVFANQTLSLNSSIQLRELSIHVDNLGRSNSALSCKLF